jgi:putative methionine-R-sulfoxide reductase with GAF domain
MSVIKRVFRGGGIEVMARVDPEPVEVRFRAIQSITDAALSSLDERELLAALLDRVREILRADTAAILLLDVSSGQLIATAAAGLEEEVRQGVHIPLGRGFAGRIAAERQPVILDHVDHTTVLNPILWARGIRSMAGVPMMAGSRVIGVMHVGSLTSRRFTEHDVELLQMAADRAAVIMGRMRSALRAYALESRDPAEVLDRLDRKMQHFEPDAMATVLYAIIDPDLGRMRVCLAGHFPPVIAIPGRPAELARVAPGLVIGIMPGAPRQVATVPIPPGTLVCFYTDGLIEHPDEPIDAGLARLCGAVTAEPAEAACVAVMGALVGNQPARDDIALLMVRRQPASPIIGSAGEETDSDG